MMGFIGVVLVMLLLGYLWYLLSQQRDLKVERQVAYKPNPPGVQCAEVAPWWPSIAEVVPSHASYSNKFNDVIGNENSGIIGEGVGEVVIASDWYMSRYLPTEFDGDYWPNGGIQPDFLYPGGDPARPLRPQTLYASQSVFPPRDSSAIYQPKNTD
jgi:hypothetical protein